jgi:hypothetical protein
MNNTINRITDAQQLQMSCNNCTAGAFSFSFAGAGREEAREKKKQCAQLKIND